VILVSNQSYGLSISSVFLYPEGETQFGREYFDILVERVDGNCPSVFFVEFLISGDKSFDDMLP
jgi:hypothetical protein